ncbi:unnamed protein product [Peniophora sp. CBMAI 1063]|nr:unnamed protein product [Peniophora sp. CBMAI 1063]
MRVPPFSLRRHSDLLEELIAHAEARPNGVGEGFSESHPIFLPSNVELKAIEAFFRRIFGPGRMEDGTQNDHPATISDIISNLKLSRYLMSRVCYFEAVNQLESVAVSTLAQDWQSMWTPLTRIAVAMACGVKKWLLLPETYMSLLTMPSVMWRSPHLQTILSGVHDVQRLVLLEKQIDRIRFHCAHESPFTLRPGPMCETVIKCQEAWDMAWRISFAPNLIQRDFPMSLPSFAEVILLKATSKDTGLCSSCHSSMLRSVKSDLQRTQRIGISAADDTEELDPYFGKEYILLRGKIEEFCAVYPAPHWKEPQIIQT